MVPRERSSTEGKDKLGKQGKEYGEGVYDISSDDSEIRPFHIDGVIGIIGGHIVIIQISYIHANNAMFCKRHSVFIKN